MQKPDCTSEPCYDSNNHHIRFRSMLAGMTKSDRIRAIRRLGFNVRYAAAMAESLQPIYAWRILYDWNMIQGQSVYRVKS